MHQRDIVPNNPNTRRDGRRVGGRARLVGLALVVVAALVAIPGAPRASAQYDDLQYYQWAYVFANEPATDTYTPAPEYQFNPTGTQNTVSRWQTGEYIVLLTGLGTYTDGIVEVTAVNNALVTCNVFEWRTADQDIKIEVRCYDAAGTAADTAYAVSWLRGTDDGFTGSYFWANQPTVASYSPELSYSYPDGPQSTANKIERLGAGSYHVTVPRGMSQDGGPFQVTPTGDQPVTCSVSNRATDFEGGIISGDVTCVDRSGTPTDAGFTLTHIFSSGMDRYHAASAELVVSGADGTIVESGQVGSYPGSDEYTLQNVTPVTRTDVGNYTIALLGSDQDSFNGSGIPQLTTLDTTNATCTVGQWQADTANDHVVTLEVHCFDLTGAPADANFDLLYFAQPA